MHSTNSHHAPHPETPSPGTHPGADGRGVTQSQQAACARLIIAGLKGGSGKTVLTLGLARRWRRQALRVVTFKKGPDYIDAAWLGAAAGSPCYNLDPYLMSRAAITASFLEHGRHSDVRLIEGNRGLHDGVDIAGSYSTAELAKWLDTPVVLVLDCTKMTRTAAAVVLGCRDLDPEVPLEGVVLNQVARSRHETIVRQAIETYTDIPVLGALPRLRRDPLPMRHLGITPCDEHPEAEEALDRLGKMVAESVDTDRLLRLAGSRPLASALFPETNPAPKSEVGSAEAVRIGILRDSAFQFYYPDNLAALEAAGARLVFVNAIKDASLPDVDALYIGGGFPETHAPQLAENETLRAAIARAIEGGLPVYAECGGLMYLGRHVVWQGVSYPMVGVLGWDFNVEKRPVGHGYSTIEVTGPNPFYEVGSRILGHEFHYSRPVLSDAARPGCLSCAVARGHGFDGEGEGLVYKNVFGTYTHVHAAGEPRWAPALVAAARQYHRGRLGRPNCAP